MSVSTRKSGEDFGAGADTGDEGYLKKSQIWDGFIWLWTTVVDKTGGDAFVGYVKDLTDEERNVEWRSYLRFDLTGLDLTSIVGVTLYWYVEDIFTVPGHSVTQESLLLEYGYNSTGGTLRTDDWDDVLTEITTIPWILWAGGGTKKQYSYEFTDLGSLRNAGEGTGRRLDIRFRLANQSADHGFYVGITTGNDVQHDEPYMDIEIGAIGDTFPVFLDSGDLGARIDAGEVVLLPHSGGLTVRVHPSNIVLPVHSGDVDLELQNA